MLLEDFYEEVLSKLGVIAAEESASASDRLAAKEKYEQVHAEYKRRGVISWAVTAAVPDWVADAFATIVAGRLTNKFSLADQDTILLKTEAAEARDMILADRQNNELPQKRDKYY